MKSWAVEGIRKDRLKNKFLSVINNRMAGRRAISVSYKNVELTRKE